jgi:hypothetical protein
MLADWISKENEADVTPEKASERVELEALLLDGNFDRVARVLKDEVDESAEVLLLNDEFVYLKDGEAVPPVLVA